MGDASLSNLIIQVLQSIREDLKRFLRVTLEVTHGTSAGLAISSPPGELLFADDGESVLVASPDLSELAVRIGHAFFVDDPGIAGLPQAHPWSSTQGASDWMLVHPVVRGHQFPPMALYVRGTGERPGREALADLVRLFAPGLALLVEVRFRKSHPTRYELLARATSDVIWDWDVRNDRLDVNENLHKVFGYRPAEENLDFAWWYDRVHPDDRNILDNGIAALLKSGHTWSGEYRFRRSDGSYALVLDQSCVARDSSGSPVRMVGAMSDISARRQAEDALKLARTELETALNRLQQFMNQSSDVLCTYDHEGRFVHVSDAAERLWGYTPESLLGRPLVELVHPDDQEFSRQQCGHVFVGGRCSDFLNRYLHRDGHSVHMQWSAVWSDQDQLGFAIARDVSDRVANLRRVRDSEERYRLVFEHNPAPMWVYDERTFKFITVNQAALDKYGYTREEFLALNVMDLVSPDTSDEVWARLGNGIGTGPRSGEWTHCAKDGTVFIVQGWSYPLNIDGTFARLAVAIDITAQRNLETQLRRSQEMEALGQLAGGIAHDFNNLLTVINGFAALALQQLDPGGGVHGQVEAILGAGERAARLTQQLLAFSRRQVLQPRVLKLNEILAAAEPMLRRLVREDIEFDFRFQPDLGLIKADAAQLEQVLMNLVINARDAMPNGGRLTIETSNIMVHSTDIVRHPDLSPGPHVCLAVKDTGSGMDAETQTHIFEPFFTTKGKEGGTGLGLPTVYGIVKQSGGDIWVQSRPGKGTTMQVVLPVTSGNLPAARRPQERAAPVHGGSETILVVEDDERVRDFTSTILRELGYQIITAGDGIEAFHRAQEFDGPIHLLLSDVILPRMSGRELSEKLAPSRPAMKVLFVSGYPEDAIAHRGLLDPGINYLPKPFTPSALSAKLREVLDDTGVGA